jgi:hypothetical protein
MKKTTTVGRYLEILNSTRFQQALAVFLLQTLNHYGILDNYLANSISMLLGLSITLRTVDRSADSLANTK